MLVGRSYGAVITVAGNSDKVAGLVHVAGVVPDEGESVDDLKGRFTDLAKRPLIQPTHVLDLAHARPGVGPGPDRGFPRRDRRAAGGCLAQTQSTYAMTPNQSKH